jgi:excinuclease ABC subunit C
MGLQTKLKNLPARPGVYLFRDSRNVVLYVGKAVQLRNRIRSYFQKSRPHDPRLRTMVGKIADVEFIITDNDIEALILEANLIKEYKPRYNINLKDDKSYPYIRITAEDFPQIFPTRKIIRDGSVYFGPYTNVKDMRQALNTLKRIFQIRSCKFDLSEQVIARKKVQLCLDYFIKKCRGPCQGLQSREAYAATIEQIKQFLRGRTDGILAALHTDMQQFAADLHFEEAARVRDKIEALEKYRNSQKVVLGDNQDRDLFALAHEDDDACVVIFRIREGKIIGRIHYYLKGTLYQTDGEILAQFVKQYYNQTDEVPPEIFLPAVPEDESVIGEWLSRRVTGGVNLIIPKSGPKKKLMEMSARNARYLLDELKLQREQAKDRLPHNVKALQRDLRLQQPPRRIECFDISNIQGTDAVASMVCFIDGRPKKSQYRKFRIRSKETPDDFAMMREVISRRYKRLRDEKQTFPDLIIVDGGKGQLSSAHSVLRELDLPDQPVIGLAKRLEEVFFPGVKDAQTLPRSSSSLRLLQQLRDEAHRFALTFHRQRRKKRTLTSRLDEIPGIGPARRERLLREFGSFSRLQKASVDEIRSKAGIHPALAIEIHKFLHPEES